jgi:hypothetical protein
MQMRARHARARSEMTADIADGCGLARAARLNQPGDRVSMLQVRARSVIISARAVRICFLGRVSGYDRRRNRLAPVANEPGKFTYMRECI